MRAIQLASPAEIEREPLRIATVAQPDPGPGELLLKIQACGVCHTDLHIAEGDLTAPSYPVVPGHQVVGRVTEIGEGVTDWKPGQRAGVTWLFSACGTCDFCRAGDENICRKALFTGLDVPGGFAEFMTVPAAFALRLPDQVEDTQAAPLLCAGIIGYRSLKLSGIRPGGRLGLVGFGASAHLTIQVAISWGCEVYVFSRTASHREHALELGAAWAGSLDEPPRKDLQAAITFAPVGHIIPQSLALLGPSGTLAINAVHLTPIPEFEYELLYDERVLRSVTNLTRQDGQEFLDIASQIGIQVSATSYALEQANKALLDLKLSELDGAAVLLP